MDHVAAVDLELRMRGVLDFEQQVAVCACSWFAAAKAALAAQPDHLARTDTLGYAHVQGLVVHRNTHAVAVMDRFQRHRQLGALVAPRRHAPAGLPTDAAASTPLAEQAFEEIAEAAPCTATGEDFLKVDAATWAAATESTGGRLNLVARAITTGTQLIVGRTLLRIAQRLVGLVDRLEFCFGAGLLADIGMVFARQPAIRGLDLRLARARLQAKRLVVILELHRQLLRASKRVRGPGPRLSRTAWQWACRFQVILTHREMPPG